MMFDLQPVLTGELISLRPLKEGDREDLFAVASDPLLWELHPQSDRYQRPVFDALFDQSINSKGALVVLDAKSGKIIGSSRYYDLNPERKSVAIGYTFLARAFCGGNYNREMKKLMLDHAFRFAETAIFHVGKNNLRSRKAMEKIGGELVGEEQRTLADGSPNPSVVYRVTKALAK